MADRVEWVQYPEQRVVSTQGRHASFWRHQMPLSTRIFLALISVFGLIMAGSLLAALCVLAWSILRQAF